jgi:syntaxin 7
MSFADAHGSGSSSVPAWAARATTTANNGSAPSWAQTRGTEPLVPAFEFAPIKKEIQRDLKEIAKAADVLAKLAKKRGDADAAQRMLAVSSETRERARATSRKIRDAFDALAEGSSDRASLAALSAEFKATLNRFSEVAEMTAPAPAPAAAPPAGAVAVQIGVGAPQPPLAPAPPDGGGGAAQAQQMEAGGLQAIETNDQIIREREAGLRQINQQVHEVSEIFQDLALLVSEQGEHIDNIQTNIESAANNTARGARELARASRYQRRARGRMCMFGVLLIIVIVALILVLKFALKMI